MRMKKKDRNTDNCIQWRLSRGWREALGMLSWHLTSNKGNTAEAVANYRVIARLSPWHQNHNTTRGLTPGRKDPRASRDAPGNWISWPTSKGGKDWGKAKITSFTDKIRKMPGPRKKKATEDVNADDDQDPDEQLEEEQLEDEQSEDETSESDEDEAEQPTASDSAYTLPSASSMAEGPGVQHSQNSYQASRRAPGPIVKDSRQQLGLGPKTTQHSRTQATQDGNLGVPRTGYNNHHHPQSRPSALPGTRRSNPLTQRVPISSSQTHQAAGSNPDVLESVSNRGAKRQIHELDMEDMPAQQQAKKPRMQPPQAANRAHLTFDEIVAGMPDATTMFLKHKAENPYLYTKEALAARKDRLQGPDAMPDVMTRFLKHKAENPHLYTKEDLSAMKLLPQGPDASATTFMDEAANKCINDQNGAVQLGEISQNRNMISSDQPAGSKSRSLQESAGGQVVGNARSVASHSRRENNELPGPNQQNMSSTPPLSSRTSTAHYPQNPQINVAASTQVPADRASMRPVPSVVGTKHHYESLDTDSVPSASQQANKARHSSSQDTNEVSLSAEANAAVPKFWNESHANRPMTATPSSQQVLNSPQVNRRQYSAPSSRIGSKHAARPVLRNSQGQNIVKSAGQITPLSSERTRSSLPQLVPRPSTPGYFGVPLPGSREDFRAPSTAYQQAYYNSGSRIGSADGHNNPAVPNHPISSNVTKPAENFNPAIKSRITGAGSATSNDAPEEDFDLDIFDPGPLTENSIVPDFPDFPEFITMQTQPEPGSEGPMTALLNMDDFDFQMPEMGDL